jgi:predicted DsbA family dithiol-disulfide isomerase
MHPDAGPAAKAMQAAKRQGKAWEMADVLFANYRKLKPDDITGYAGEVGLDVEKFKVDFASAEVGKEVAGDTKAASQAGVRGTPTILVNGLKHRGPRTLEGFKPVIDGEIKKADELIKKGTPIEKVYEALVKSK